MLSKWIIFHLRMGMEGLTPVFWLCPDRKFFTWPPVLRKSASQRHPHWCGLHSAFLLQLSELPLLKGVQWLHLGSRSFWTAQEPHCCSPSYGQHSCHSNVCLLPQQFSNNRLNSHMQNFWIRAQIGEQSLTYTSFSIKNWCDRFISQENLQSEQSNVTLILEA